MDNEKNPVDQQKRESNKKKLYITWSEPQKLDT